VLAGGGCGGDGDGGEPLSKADYEREVAEVGETLESTTTQLGGALAGGSLDSLDEAAGEIEELADAVDEAADELDDLNAPENAADAHDQLVEGLHGFADDIRQLAEDAEDGDLQALRDFGENLEGSEAVRQIEEATDELEAAGYRLGTEDEEDSG
jgi:hypothetical protein